MKGDQGLARPQKGFGDWRRTGEPELTGDVKGLGKGLKNWST